MSAQGEISLVPIDNENLHASNIKKQSISSETFEEIKGAPPKQATWLTVGFLQITDVVGAGVMSLSAVCIFSIKFNG